MGWGMRDGLVNVGKWLWLSGGCRDPQGRHSPLHRREWKTAVLPKEFGVISKAGVKDLWMNVG